MTGYSLPPQLNEEIDQLGELIEKFKKGEVAATELKAHRVPFGVYEQREPDTYMVRIRCAAGALTPRQLEQVAQIASRFSTSDLHITTRQELQVHYVRLNDLIPLIQALKEIGLATRGGGGNTVRNIVAAPDAGTDPQELFDVLPYATALTTRLIAENDSWNLPRKFKVAFSGSPEDKGYATISDVGFLARIKDGRQGFRVYAAGGLGSKSEAGKLLLDFVEAGQVYPVAKALKNLFWKYGNRKNKHAARLRFLWGSLGEEEFKNRFHDEYAKIQEQGFVPLAIEASLPLAAPISLSPETPSDPKGFSNWSKRFISAQKQQGFFSVGIPIELGFVPLERAAALGRFLQPFGDDVLRLTKDQNFLLRNIPEAHLGNVYNFLTEKLLGVDRPAIYGRILSCAGASTCQLGICLSRQAARALMRTLEKSGLDLDQIGPVRVNFSGCPNSCGQHPAADLGFFGKAQRKEGHLYPAYNVVAGAVIHDEKTQLAEVVGEIPAKHLPALVKEFFTLFLSKVPPAGTFQEYVRHEGKADLKRLCARYQEIPAFHEDKNFYFDWDASVLFSLAERGAGECSAGLFDLIELDLKNIKRTKEQLVTASSDPEKRGPHLAGLVFYSSRMLLITRGVDPKSEQEAFGAFSRYFFETSLIARSYQPLLDLVRVKNYPALLAAEKEVVTFAEVIAALYASMDNSFNFKIPSPSVDSQGGKSLAAVSEGEENGLPAIVKDLRGVACPMNFVKTKVELSKLKPGEILEVWLDEGAPIENVPGSVKAEGHKVLSQKRAEDYWAVVIKKA